MDRRSASLAGGMSAAVLATAIMGACIPTTPACDELPDVVEITVAAGEMEPSNIAVCRGDEVTLRVSPQVDGVLHVHGYDEELPAAEIVAGQPVELRFRAARSGQFPVELHPADDPEGVGLGLLTVHEP